jgi:hypothetical protein
LSDKTFYKRALPILRLYSFSVVNIERRFFAGILFKSVWLSAPLNPDNSSSLDKLRLHQTKKYILSVLHQGGDISPTEKNSNTRNTSGFGELVLEYL